MAENLHTKAELVRQALQIASDRLRNMFKSSEITRYEMESGLRRIDLTLVSSGAHRSVDPNSLTLFPYLGDTEKTKEFLRTKGFKSLFDIVERNPGEIRKEFARIGIEMPKTFQLFYEVYHELLSETYRSTTERIH